ncbi:hypothetical protein [Sporomusa acidovorans]|uniref:Killing trait n=1 Tax=Sporomusa acidovorans (strain ATCC 49682 / DSM 3132 / Mol) TaxID=1123286 RepID=A0ABZ3J3Z1_SPOA4|nr:hypothetical protein [Sporomusa acidovorans]OZC20285.1 hypothetical protein SPACI_26830 [Sporomusa acidovorans DSM 3132]SDD39310.1 hypothetical protein SAMN04488499_1001100 [Sporomusa acidovorans]
MDNQQIATLTTQIIAAAVTNTQLSLNATAIVNLYQQVFNIIKQMDQTT